MHSVLHIFVIVAMVALIILQSFNIYLYKECKNVGGTPNTNESTFTVMYILSILSVIFLSFFTLWATYDLFFCGKGKKCKNKLSLDNLF